MPARAKPIAKEDYPGILRAYQQGKTKDEIQIMFSCSRKTLNRILRMNGINGQTKHSDKERKDILRYYNLGWTYKQIAQEIGCAEGYVSYYISQSGSANRNAARRDPDWMPGGPLRLDGTPDTRVKNEEDLEHYGTPRHSERYPRTSGRYPWGETKIKEETPMESNDRISGLVSAAEEESKKISLEIERIMHITGEDTTYEARNDNVSVDIFNNIDHERSNCAMFTVSREVFIKMAREMSAIADMMEKGEA